MNIHRYVILGIWTTVLSFLLTPVISEQPLLCHEGFNASIGGIPIYLWSESRCANATSCMVQETSIKYSPIRFAHASLRYGGCFPRQLQYRLSCSNAATSLITVDEIAQLAAVLDSKLLSLTFELHLNPRKHMKRFLSRGKEITEFSEGVLDFLASIGYNKEDIRNPLRDLIHGKVKDFNENRRNLLHAMAVDNDVTERFAFSLEAFLLRFSDDVVLPKTISEIIELLPGLFYPMLQSVGVNVDAIMDDISTMLESSNNVHSERICSSSVPVLYILQIIIVSFERTSDKEANTIMYKATKNITEHCLLTYPNNEQFKRINLAIKALNDAAKESYKCRLGTVKCRIKLMKALQNIPQRVLQQSPPTSNNTFDDALRDLYTDYTSAIDDVRENPMAYLGSVISHIVSKTNVKLLKVIHMMQENSWKEENNVITSCNEFRCFTDMCNTHEAFMQSQMTSSEERQQKTEL